MNDNLIQYVPAALQSSDVVPALETLILSDNYLTFLKTGAFYNVSTLTSLYVLKTHDNFINIYKYLWLAWTNMMHKVYVILLFKL